MTAIDALVLSEGDLLLMAGATGGVGNLAVPLAAPSRARILAPALPDDESFLRELGVSDVLPRGGDIAELARERHPRRRRRARPRQLRPRHVRRGAQARSARRLAHRRRPAKGPVAPT